MHCRESIRARARWGFLGFLIAGLVAVVVPARQIGIGRETLKGLTGSYLYELDYPVQTAVSNLHLVDVFVGGSLRLEWDYSPLGYGTPEFLVQRAAAGGSTWTTVYAGPDQHAVDTGLSFGTAYEYRVGVTSDQSGPSLGLGAPPSGADPGDIYGIEFVPTSVPYDDGVHTPILDRDWRCLQVTPTQVTAGHNQTVDSRYDPRYSTYVYKNFPFGDTIYRGGLFSGYNADASRVGRSFVRFTLPSLASGQSVLAGSVNAYATRNYTLGTTRTIGCSPVSDVTWTQSGIRWSTAPALPSGFPAKSADVTYHSVTSGMTTTIRVDVDNGLSYLDPTGNWAHWILTDDINSAATGSGAFSAVIASTSETTNGWVYFAKKEYDSSLGPRLVYGAGGIKYPAALTLANSTVPAGTTATGIIRLGDSGTATFTLSSSDTSKATVPSSTTVSGGLTGNFNITTFSGHPGTVTIYATGGSVTRSVVLTIS